MEKIATRNPESVDKPIRLVEILQRRLADFPNMLAEGGKNFWDEFQLIPVSERFWLENLRFELSTPVMPREADVRGERLLSVIDAAERPDTAVRAGEGRDRTGTD